MIKTSLLFSVAENILHAIEESLNQLVLLQTVEKKRNLPVTAANPNPPPDTVKLAEPVLGLFCKCDELNESYSS